MARYFICPHCKEVNTSEDWDRATFEEFNDIVSILNAKIGYIYVCPSCKKHTEIGCAEVTNLKQAFESFVINIPNLEISKMDEETREKLMDYISKSAGTCQYY